MDLIERASGNKLEFPFKSSSNGIFGFGRAYHQKEWTCHHLKWPSRELDIRLIARKRQLIRWPSASSSGVPSMMLGSTFSIFTLEKRLSTYIGRTKEIYNRCLRSYNHAFESPLVWKSTIVFESFLVKKKKNSLNLYLRKASELNVEVLLHAGRVWRCLTLTPPELREPRPWSPCRRRPGPGMCIQPLPIYSNPIRIQKTYQASVLWLTVSDRPWGYKVLVGDEDSMPGKVSICADSWGVRKLLSHVFRNMRLSRTPRDLQLQVVWIKKNMFKKDPL